MNFVPVFMLAAAVIAAGKPAPRIGASESLLLNSPEVIKALKLTPEQDKAVKKAVNQMHGRIARRMKKDDEEFDLEQKRRTEAGLPTDESPRNIRVLDGGEVEQSDDDLSRILSPSQIRRLHQINLQLHRFNALARPDVVEPLNLSPETVILVKEVLADHREGQDRLIAAFNKGPNGSSLQAYKAYRQKVAKLSAEEANLERNTQSRVRKLLSKKQWAKFQAMLGPPFDEKILTPPMASNLAVIDKTLAKIEVAEKK